MFGSSLLDVAIGTIFVYLLLSLVCSALNEIIESWLKMRASYLERGIRQMLDDASGGELAEKLYNHPLISSLFPGKYDPTQIKKGIYASRSDLPSYIPARNFALALMDVILPAQSAAGSESSPPADSESPFTRLRNAIAENATGQTQTALLTLVDAAGGDIVKTRENIEEWYNSSMDRVSGWYKRRAHATILILGLIAAIALNADSVYIVRTLSNDSTLRSSLVAAATEYAKEPPAQEDETAEDKFDANVKRIQSLGLPIGWTNDPSDEVRKSPGLPWRESPTLGAWLKAWARLFYWHWLGWIITAAAISQGAPFWFDLLNRFIVIRSTVKPHEKSPEESSKE